MGGERPTGGRFLTVDCSNCGPGPEAWAALILAALSFIVAVAALVYAKHSVDSAKDAVALAREEVEMTRAEHEAWLRELKARADLRIALRTMGADPDGVLRTESSGIFVRVEIGLSNDGQRAAGPTNVTALVPYPMPFKWCTETGQELEQPFDPSRLENGETLAHPDRGEVEAWYRTWRLERVGLREHPCLYVSFPVHLPDPLRAGAEVTVPLRAKASAEEMPEDVPDEVVEHLVHVRYEPAEAGT